MDGERYVDSLQSLMGKAAIPADPYPFPQVANVVTTWRMVPESQKRAKNRKMRRLNRGRSVARGQRLDDYTLDLRSFVRYNPTAKLNTSNFASVICRACDQTTSLLFSSGSGVTVHAKSPSLGIYACRVYTHLIERTPMLIMGEDAESASTWKAGTQTLPGVPSMRTLEGRIMFSACFLENVVAYGYLGCRISLERIYAVRPQHVRYDPGNFPGLEWQSEVTDSVTGEKKVLKNLIFETGMWIIIGAQDICFANEVFWRLRKIAHEFRADAPPLNEDERHEARLRRLWAELYRPLINDGDQEEIAAVLPAAAPKSQEQVMREAAHRLEVEREMGRQQEAARRLRERRKREHYVTEEEEQAQAELKRKRREEQHQREEDEAWSPLMCAAYRGQLANVQMLLDMGADPAFVNNAGKTILCLLDECEGDAYVAVRQALMEKLLPPPPPDNLD